MAVFASIESHPKFQNKTRNETKIHECEGNYLKFIQNELDEDDYVDILEGIISPQAYDKLDDCIKDLVDGFYETTGRK